MFVYFHGSLSAKHKSGHCHRGLWSVGGFWVLVKPATRVQNQKILSGGKHFPRRVGGNCTKIWKAYQHACPLGTGRLQQTNSVPFSLNKKRKEKHLLVQQEQLWQKVLSFLENSTWVSWRTVTMEKMKLITFLFLLCVPSTIHFKQICLLFSAQLG